MAIRIPSTIFSQTPDSIKFSVTQQIDSLNQFLPSATSIKRCKDKGTEWEFLANRWTRYKNKWSKALAIVPQRPRIESISHTVIVSDRSRLIDVENLYGGSKPIRDFLERRGWVYNDSPKWSTLEITQRKVKKGEEKTWVKITLDIPDE